MRTIKSVIIVTNAGQVEGVFTSFRALSQSNGVSHINIEGVYETYTETEVRLLLKWYTSSLSKQFPLKRLKKFQYVGKINYIWDKQHGQHNDYQSQRIN